MGCGDDHRYDEPACLYQEMPFAPFALWGPSKPTPSPCVAVLLLWLAVQQADGSGRRPWLCRSHWRMVSMTCPHTTAYHHCLPPVGTIAIDRAGSAAMRGHHAPLAPDFVDVEHATEDAADVHGLLGRMGAGPAGVEGEPIAQRSHLWDSDTQCSWSTLLTSIVDR